jgi:hypothetical protein
MSSLTPHLGPAPRARPSLDCHGCSVSGGTAPARGVLGASALVPPDAVPPRSPARDPRGAPAWRSGVALRRGAPAWRSGVALRRHEANHSVLMLVILPVREGVDPRLCRRKIGERSRRIRRAVLERAEQRFRERIAVAHARPTERRQDAEAFQPRDHRARLHRTAAIGVQHEAVGFSATRSQVRVKSAAACTASSVA